MRSMEHDVDKWEMDLGNLSAEMNRLRADCEHYKLALARMTYERDSLALRLHLATPGANAQPSSPLLPGVDAPKEFFRSSVKIDIAPPVGGGNASDPHHVSEGEDALTYYRRVPFVSGSMRARRELHELKAKP